MGSAAFSKAVQCLDLHTGESVCIKIIKNNKDFFDQSLDEIKLLQYIKRHDPEDAHNVLHIYDYFYHKVRVRGRGRGRVRGRGSAAHLRLLLPQGAPLTLTLTLTPNPTPNP